MGLSMNSTVDLTGDNYKAGPRKAKLRIVDISDFKGDFSDEAIKVSFEEVDTEIKYSEIFSIKKHPDAKINGLLRAAFDTTDIKFKLKDLIDKVVTGYVYTKTNGHKGVKFEQNGDEF
jgi:hypothetical protein